MEHSISLLRSCRTQSLIPKLVAWKLYQFPFSSTVSISIESGKQCKRLDEIFFFREIENPTKFLCHLLLKINFKQNKIRRIMLMKPWSFKIHCHNMNTRTFFLSTYKHIKITIIVIISRWFIFLKTKSRREEEKKRRKEQEEQGGFLTKGGVFREGWTRLGRERREWYWRWLCGCDVWLKEKKRGRTVEKLQNMNWCS